MSANCFSGIALFIAQKTFNVFHSRMRHNMVIIRSFLHQRFETDGADVFGRVFRMHRDNVPLEIFIGAETSSAFAHQKGLLVVYFPMFSERISMRKLFATYVAIQQTFAGVELNMILQFLFFGEFFSAVRTLAMLFSCVHFFMRSACPLITEPLLAIRALVGLRPSVYPNMARQIRPLRERFCAMRTLMFGTNMD